MINKCNPDCDVNPKRCPLLTTPQIVQQNQVSLIQRLKMSSSIRLRRSSVFLVTGSKRISCSIRSRRPVGIPFTCRVYVTGVNFYSDQNETYRIYSPGYLQ